MRLRGSLPNMLDIGIPPSLFSSQHREEENSGYGVSIYLAEIIYPFLRVFSRRWPA